MALTKPRIISLLLLTTVATMFVADPSLPALSTVLWTMLGGYLAAGGAGAINHYLDRDRDARMARTRPAAGRRAGSSRWHGLVFGIALGAARDDPAGAHRQRARRRARARRAARVRGRLHDLAQAADPAEHRHRRRRRRRAAAGRLGGGDRRPGARRAVPVRDRLPLDPPHFWALSLLIKDDYARTGVPMLPVVKGEAATRRQILAYTLILVAFTPAPGRHRLPRRDLPRRRGRPRRRLHRAGRAPAAPPSRRAALRLYLASLAYLALLFCAMAADRAV